MKDEIEFSVSRMWDGLDIHSKTTKLEEINQIGKMDLAVDACSGQGMCTYVHMCVRACACTCMCRLEKSVGRSFYGKRKMFNSVWAVVD